MPVLLTISEESRRMEEMMKMYAASGFGMGMNNLPTEATLTVNTASPLIAKLSDMAEDKREQIAAYLYQLAVLSQRKLSADELQKFLGDSYAMLESL